MDADVSAALRAGSLSSKSCAEDEGDYEENTTKLVHLRRRVAMLRASSQYSVVVQFRHEVTQSGRLSVQLDTRAANELGQPDQREQKQSRQLGGVGPPL